MIPLSGRIIKKKVEIKAIRGEIKQSSGIEQKRKLQQLAEAYDDLGRAYHEKGDEESAKWAFDNARDARKKVSQFVVDKRTGE